MGVDGLTLSPNERSLIVAVLNRFDRRKRGASRLIVSCDELYSLLTPEQGEIVRRVVGIDPYGLGFRGPFIGLTEPPDNLVLVRGQEFAPGADGARQRIAPQYVSRTVLAAFRKMNRALRRETAGRTLLIESGYRSPAYQAVVFLRSLAFQHDFDFRETLKCVALPGYSEHGRPQKQALDLATPLGSSVSGDGPDFSTTREYAWLLKNACRFWFVLSYMRGNPYGIAYEPWHWRYFGPRHA